MLNISLISSFFWHVKIVHFLCSNFQVFAGIFTRCPTCQRAHIYHFCSFCIRCHICHFPIAIWSQNLGIGTIFEANLPLKTGCNKFQMESVKMKKATKTVAEIKKYKSKITDIRRVVWNNYRYLFKIKF